jgi:hypothetical protein
VNRQGNGRDRHKGAFGRGFGVVRRYVLAGAVLRFVGAPGHNELIGAGSAWEQAVCLRGPVNRQNLAYRHYSKVVEILERVLTGVELGFNRVGNIDM